MKIKESKIGIILLVVVLILTISVVYQYYHYTKGTDCGCQIKYFPDQSVDKPTMYGSYMCSHCIYQKTLIDEIKYNYIECTTNIGQAEECINNNIRAYPTWIFKNGNRHEGVIDNSEFNSLLLVKEE